MKTDSVILFSSSSERARTRAPGPRSAPITTSAEWAPIIHRCVLRERESLAATLREGLRIAGELGGLGVGSRDGAQRPEPPPLQPTTDLALWHEARNQEFLEQLRIHKPEWPVPLGRNHLQLTLAVRQTPPATVIPNTDLLEALRKMNAAVKEIVWTGWSMFYPFTREEIRPRLIVEHEGGADLDAYQTNLMESIRPASMPDFWRVRQDGLATIVRAYREDRGDVTGAPRLKPGTWFQPWNLERDLVEFLAFGFTFANTYFENAAVLDVRATWRGLKGRSLGDPRRDWPSRQSDVDERTVLLTHPVAGAMDRLPEVAAELGGPILGYFGLQLTGAWIRADMPSFRTLPSNID